MSTPILRRLGGLFVAVLASTAAAGDYHDGLSLNCSECHVMHLQPGQGASLGLFPVPLSTSSVGTPADTALDLDEQAVKSGVDRRLLREDVNDLCLSCHDDSARAADVLGANLGRFPSDVRQAGHLNRLGHDGNVATGHTLDSTETAPGSQPPWRAEDENGPGVGLNCLNCHAAHGNESYRNLRDDAGHNLPGAGRVTYNRESPGSNHLGRDVFVRATLAYDESAVDFNEPDPDDSAMARFCAGCHDLFHGQPGVDANIGGTRTGASFTQFLRHPTSGVDIGAVGGEWSSSMLFASHDNRVKVMSRAGLWDPPGSDVTPSCMSCHKAHGNGNAFGLILRSGRGVPTEDGDTHGGSLEHLCGQCHAQAAAPALP
ncbi:MAG: hypothetical protein H6825_08165 [Planctomycetes bacterium]|nr:hypothetical protein [Planctomycetota bacterium]